MSKPVNPYEHLPDDRESTTRTMTLVSNEDISAIRSLNPKMPIQTVVAILFHRFVQKLKQLDLSYDPDRLDLALNTADIDFTFLAGSGSPIVGDQPHRPTIDNPNGCRTGGVARQSKNTGDLAASLSSAPKKTVVGKGKATK